MLKKAPSWLMKTNNWIAENFGENPGKMLTWTGVAGWFLSSLAQVVAIIINDKIPKEQKMFLIPQEIADAAVNVSSFFLITQAFRTFTSNFVKYGKLLPLSIRTKLEKSGKSLDKLISADNNVKSEFDSFEKGTDVLAQTVGSIVACNIVTPIIRNKIAAKRQQESLTRYQSQISTPYTKPQINDFLGLKI